MSQEGGNIGGDGENTSALVIDNGSGQVKAGVAGEDAPFAVFPSIIGEPKGKSAMSGVETKDMYVGNEASAKRGILTLKYPIEHGVITDWTAMERIWEHTFAQHLRVDPALHSVLLTEAPCNPKSNREKMMEIMFDEFHVPGCYVQIQAVLSLYASGRTTGLVFDAGDGVSHTVPIYEGFAVRKTILRMDCAGRDLTGVMQRELKAEGFPLESSAEKEICRDIKEKLAYVAPSFQVESGKPDSEIAREYTLPDGNVITVGPALYKTGECLFDPKMIMEMEDPYGGVHGQIAKSITSSEMDLRAALSRNIVLSGGTTMLTGFEQRLNIELPLSLASDVKVHAPPERKYSVWIGGSILASLSSFANMMVGRDEYDEEGSAVIHRKCF